MSLGAAEGFQRPVQEVPVRGPQGRHDVCAPHVLHFGVEASQQFVTGAHGGRAAQEHVLRSVGFLPAYRAAGRAALRVIALLALPGGRLPDPVSPLGRNGPVAGSQLVDVDRGLPVSSGDGRGRRAPISKRYHPAGQACMVRVRASLAAARCAVLTSTVAVASLAIESARSLPLRPQWEGTHCRTIWRPPSDSPFSFLQMPMPNGELWAAGPSRSEARADWESVHTTIGSSTCAGFSRR